jgi:long-chain acyl-CoA synthetase
MAEVLPETLCDLLDAAAARHGAKLAVAGRVGLRTERLTYAELACAAEAVAGQVMALPGLARGDRVLICAPNGPRLVAVLFGLLRAGMVAVPLDQKSTPGFVAAVALRTGAVALIGSWRGVVPEGLRAIDIATLDLAATGAFDGPRPQPAELAEIVFTSGTTGDPKGAMLTHSNIVQDVIAAARIIPETVTLDLLSILPLSHMFEQTVGLFLPILNGGSVHYAPAMLPSVILAEMQRRRVAGMVVVPRFLQLVLAAVERRIAEKGLSQLWRWQNRLAGHLPLRARRVLFWRVHRALGQRLDFVICGGASLPPDTALAWERLGVRVIEGYGATECAPVIACNSYDQRVPGSVGRPLDRVGLRLSDEGEVQVRGPNVFSGYWQDAARSKACRTDDGWFRTGDLGVIDAEGRLSIQARLSDRIVLPSGMKVYPADVEAELMQEAGIRDCAVVGLPGPDGQEQVHAVVLAPGAAQGALTDAVAKANRRLATHQRIMGLTVWQGDFPRTGLHKVKRRLLQSMLAVSGGGAASVQAGSVPAGDDRLAGVAALLRRILRDPQAVITEGTRLEADLGLDSLGRIELAALIEQETGREVAEEEVNALDRVADLSALLTEGAAVGRGGAEVPDFPDWPLHPVAVALRAAVQRGLLFPLHGVFCRPFRVEGADAVDLAGGPVLLVANHSSHADTVSILRALPPALRRRTAVAAASDYFYSGRLRGALASLVLNTFAFSRAGRVRASLERCGQLCDDGWSVLIYPEGTRSPDGRLLPFRTGIGLLAPGLGVPVVPVSVVGGHEVLPKGASRPRQAAVTVRFGPAVRIPPDMPPETAARRLQEAVARGLPAALVPLDSWEARHDPQ